MDGMTNLHIQIVEPPNCETQRNFYKKLNFSPDMVIYLRIHTKPQKRASIWVKLASKEEKLK